ncbi:hypothetical protein L484_007055 [Morus notabilis]|uniref:Uncharacterized protein n=1 Tax=Morus notabilis TaxID=981085 RepID=W9S9N9_9ROSA|nr:hypothetical protein L484_007055 [Morus notabilis]
MRGRVFDNLSGNLKLLSLRVRRNSNAIVREKVGIGRDAPFLNLFARGNASNELKVESGGRAPLAQVT